MNADSETPWLDAAQQAQWRALVLGTTLLMDRLDADLRQTFNISLTEYEILVRLSEREGRQMRMSALADALAHSRSRVTHTVARMERDGYLQRCSSPDDGRGIIASMTEAGWQLLQQAAPLHVRGVRDYLVDIVPAEDLAATGRAMNRVADELVSGHPEMDIRRPAR